MTATAGSDNFGRGSKGAAAKRPGFPTGSAADRGDLSAGGQCEDAGWFRLMWITSTDVSLWPPPFLTRPVHPQVGDARCAVAWKAGGVGPWPSQRRGGARRGETRTPAPACRRSRSHDIDNRAKATRSSRFAVTPDVLVAPTVGGTSAVWAHQSADRCCGCCCRRR